MKTFTEEEVNALVGRWALTGVDEKDLQGQVVIYTGVFQWEDGSYHDEADPSRHDNEDDDVSIY